MSNGRFNLDDYETVADRITRFWHDHPQGRIITAPVLELCQTNRWVVGAQIYRDAIDQAATGYAEETVGEGMVNKSAALENCETSAIGRALANMGYSTSKSRASREEMEKVERSNEAEQRLRHINTLKLKLAARLGKDAARLAWQEGEEDGLSPDEIVEQALAQREPEIEHVSPPPLAEEEAVEPVGGGDLPSSPPPAPAIPDDPGEAWQELLKHLDTHPDVRWVKDDIHAWIKELFSLMTVTQLWWEQALQYSLAEHHPDLELWKGERHVSTLKKDEMIRFADMAFLGAKQRVAEEGASESDQ